MMMSSDDDKNDEKIENNKINDERNKYIYVSDFRKALKYFMFMLIEVQKNQRSL